MPLPPVGPWWVRAGTGWAPPPRVPPPLRRYRRGVTRAVPADHRYRGGRGRQPGQRLRAQGRRVPVREQRRGAGAGDSGSGRGGERGWEREPVWRSRPAPVQAPPGPVVTDVLVLSERSPQPAGYSRVPEFPEPRKCPPTPRWQRGRCPVLSPPFRQEPAAPGRSGST